MSFKVPALEYKVIHRDPQFLSSLEPVMEYMK